MSPVLGKKYILNAITPDFDFVPSWFTIKTIDTERDLVTLETRTGKEVTLSVVAWTQLWNCNIIMEYR